MISVDFENWRKGRVPHQINNFGALLFMMIAKADAGNLEKLRVIYPEQVLIYERWEYDEHQVMQRKTKRGVAWWAKIKPDGTAHVKRFFTPEPLLEAARLPPPLNLVVGPYSAETHAEAVARGQTLLIEKLERIRRGA